MAILAELVLRVFRYLTLRDLGRCARVSRAWRVAAEDASIWHHVATGRRWDDLAHWTLRHSRDDIALLNGDGSPAWKRICSVRAAYDKVSCDVM